MIGHLKRKKGMFELLVVLSIKEPHTSPDSKQATNESGPKSKMRLRRLLAIYTANLLINK